MNRSVPLRFLSSRPFLVGLFLVVGAIVAMPLFVTELAEANCTTPSPTNPSWDCVHPTVVDFRIPVLMLLSGAALMLLAVVRMRHANRGDGQ